MKEIQGWLSPEIATAMRNLILETKPNVMVEIGVFAGKSLIHCAEALRENGKGVIYGIDPWRKEEAEKGLGTMEDPGYWDTVDLDAVHYDCMRNIWERGLEEYAVVIRSASQHCVPLFRRNSIDILYIDGGHSEQSSLNDVWNYWIKVKRGGHIWFDDADWASTHKATDYLKRACNWKKDFGNAHLYQKV